VQAAFLLVSLPVSVTAAFLVQAQKHRARQRHQYERQHHGFVVIFLPHFAQVFVNQRGECLPFGARQEQRGGKFADTGGGGKRHAAPQCGQPPPPSSMETAMVLALARVSDQLAEQAHQVFKNLKAVCEAAGGSLNDIVKINAYLTDLSNFAVFNEVMGQYFTQPFPARAAVGVAALPRDALVEAEAVMVLAD